MGVLAYALDDDPSDHGQTTRRTVLLSPMGTVVAEAPVAYHILTVVDLDGDGVDEILTPEGAIHWTGRQWVFPPRRVEDSCLR